MEYIVNIRTRLSRSSPASLGQRSNEEVLHGLNFVWHQSRAWKRVELSSTLCENYTRNNECHYLWIYDMEARTQRVSPCIPQQSFLALADFFHLSGHLWLFPVTIRRDVGHIPCLFRILLTSTCRANASMSSRSSAACCCCVASAPSKERRRGI